jgi:energy-coupling factor transport system permease protein
MTGLGRALPHDSLLHRRNPTVKLAVFFAVSLVALVPVDVWTPLVLATVAAPSVAWAGRIPWGTLGRAAVMFAPFACSLVAVNAVTRGGPVVAVVAGLDVTSTGLRIGVALALRTVLVGTLAVAFTLTTDGARLMTSLHQHARLGARATFAVLAGYRVLEDLPDRWTTIRQAQSVRDPRRRPGALPRDPASLARAAFALLVAALRQGERLAIAMETRGFGPGPRTVHRPVPLDRRDTAFAVVVIGTCLLVVAASWRLGVLRTWASPGGS